MDESLFRIRRTGIPDWTTPCRLLQPRSTPVFRYRALNAALSDTPVVLVIGPRQAGKSTLVRQFSLTGARPYLTLDDQSLLMSAKNDPQGLISSLDLATIDEIQRVPELLLAIKKSVDEDRRPGRFLLTGSADILTLPTVSESLAGRMEIVPLLPLAMAEIKKSPPSFFDKAFEGRLPDPPEPLSGQALTESVLTGGYPELLRRPDPVRRSRWVRDYLESLFSRDVGEISGIEKHDALLRLFRLVASRSGQMPNFSQWGGVLGLDDKTTKRYLIVLEQLFLAFRLPAWHTNLSSRIVKTPKVYAMDSGVCALVTGTTREGLERDRSLFGPLLETFVVSELKKQAQWCDGNVSLSHYRDKDQDEVDILCEDESGRIVAIEVKASMTVTGQDFRGLRKLAGLLGKRMSLGLLLHDGSHVLPFGDTLFAAPVSILWGGESGRENRKDIRS